MGIFPLGFFFYVFQALLGNGPTSRASPVRPGPPMVRNLELGAASGVERRPLSPARNFQNAETWVPGGQRGREKQKYSDT